MSISGITDITLCKLIPLHASFIVQLYVNIMQIWHLAKTATYQYNQCISLNWDSIFRPDKYAYVMAFAQAVNPGLATPWSPLWFDDSLVELFRLNALVKSDYKCIQTNKTTKSK